MERKGRKWAWKCIVRRQSIENSSQNRKYEITKREYASHYSLVKSKGFFPFLQLGILISKGINSTKIYNIFLLQIEYLIKFKYIILFPVWKGVQEETFYREIIDIWLRYIWHVSLSNLNLLIKGWKKILITINEMWNKSNEDEQWNQKRWSSRRIKLQAKYT
jgi:hypothetical protein